MTKLDPHIAYVHCRDNVPIQKALPGYTKEVTFRGLRSCEVPNASVHSTVSTVGCDFYPANSNPLATHDQLKQSDNNAEGLCHGLARNEVQTNPTAEFFILDQNIEDCNVCNDLKAESLNIENSEICYLQGMRCQKHSTLIKDSAILKNIKVGLASSSPTRSPLSNYIKDRKRTPSGGSVIKHIQHVLEKEEEEVKEACKSCDCPWRMYFVMATLLLANLLNYMDRYTIAGIFIPCLRHH